MFSGVLDVTAGSTTGVFPIDYRVGYDTTYEDFVLDVPLTIGAATDTDGDGMTDSWEAIYACVDGLVGDSTLDPELVNGTKVRLGKERLRCVWRHGQLFDRAGNPVDLQEMGSSAP